MRAQRYGTGLGLLLLFCLAFAGVTRAGDGLVSTMELVDGIASIDGIRLVRAEDIPVPFYTEDHGPSQVLEIIRPDMRPVSIGRLSTSCSCITATVPKRDFAQGERAIIEVRNVKPSQPGGATYAVWAQISSPYRAALQYEVFVKSDRTPGPPPPTEASNLPGTGAGKENVVNYDEIKQYAPKPSEERGASIATDSSEKETGVEAE